MVCCPIAVITLATLNQTYQGDIGKAWSGDGGARTTDYRTPAIAVAVFAASGILFLKTLPPQNIVHGPTTPAGLQASYVDNGIHAFVMTIVLFVTGSDLGPMRLYPIDVWVNHLPELFVVTNVFSFALCTWLLLRTYWVPRSRDYSTSGSLIADYYVGRELHPTFLGGIDIKQFTNCRFGMMLWPVMVVSSAGHEYKVRGSLSYATMVTGGLQMLYLIKFFLWERGYFSTIDMMHDRAGFYLCWGCINWVPCLYANASIFLAFAPHTTDMSGPGAALCFAFGILSLVLNYDADLQRTRFRRAQDQDKFKVWGRRAEYLLAPYRTEDGQEHVNKLLLSGYWGLSRHFNYLAELLFTYSCAMPCLFVGSASPIVGWFYGLFLTILLVDRCYRDEARCSSKYGDKWVEYCQRVPYRIIPYVY
jgi:7-dehydrocholesterol reductase